MQIYGIQTCDTHICIHTCKTHQCTCTLILLPSANLHPCAHTHVTIYQLSIHPSIHPSVHPHPSIHPCMRASVHTSYVHTYIHIYIHTHRHTHIRRYVHPYMMHACMHACNGRTHLLLGHTAHKHTCMYAFMPTYIHTYTYVHTYIQRTLQYFALRYVVLLVTFCHVMSCNIRLRSLTSTLEYITEPWPFACSCACAYLHICRYQGANLSLPKRHMLKKDEWIGERTLVLLVLLLLLPPPPPLLRPQRRRRRPLRLRLILPLLLLLLRWRRNDNHSKNGSNTSYGMLRLLWASHVNTSTIHDSKHNQHGYVQSYRPSRHSACRLQLQLRESSTHIPPACSSSSTISRHFKSLRRMSSIGGFFRFNIRTRESFFGLSMDARSR